MNNQIVEVRPQQGSLVAQEGRMSVQQVVQHALTVQEVMRSVMREGMHYGKIPGTDKPTLLQPGADVLCMTFRIAQKFNVEDLSAPDSIRYRVTCVGVHQGSGLELGTGIGEASSSEEKYKWRRAVNDKEFEATPANLRRVKYGKSWEAKQVRTEPADVANTVLKMAAKRAKTAMVLNVTAASDMFGQDLEDLDAALRESLTAGDAPAATPAPPAAPAVWPDDTFAAQLVRWTKAVQAGLKTREDILALAQSKGALTPEQTAQINGIPDAPAVAPEPTPAPAPAAVDDDFVSQMNAAEGAQGGAA